MVWFGVSCGPKVLIIVACRRWCVCQPPPPILKKEQLYPTHGFGLQVSPCCPALNFKIPKPKIHPCHPARAFGISRQSTAT